MKAKDYDFLIKAILIGEGAAGKTSLAERFCNKTFETSYLMTVGVNFYTKIIVFDDLRVNLQIWDLAGQERFKFIRPRFYLGAMLCLAVFDLTRFITLFNLNDWLEELYDNIEEPVIPTILLGNKIDLAEHRAIDHQEGVDFISTLHEKFPNYKNYEVPYIETSAKTGKNVEEAFKIVTEKYLKEVLDSEY